MSPARRAGGFTLIELLVVISVIALLASLVLPVIQAAISSAERTQCISNLGQIGKSLAVYSGSFDRFLPYNDRAASGWPRHWYCHNAFDEDTDDFDVLGRLYDAHMIEDPNVFYCPSYDGTWLHNPGPDVWLEARETRTGGDINCTYIYRGRPTRPFCFTLAKVGSHAIARERGCYHGLPWFNVLYGDSSVERFSNLDGRVKQDFYNDSLYADWEVFDDRPR